MTKVCDWLWCFLQHIAQKLTCWKLKHAMQSQFGTRTMPNYFMSMFLGRVTLVAQRPIVVKLSRGRSVGLYVRTCISRSVCPVHYGKTADRIQMPFGIIGRMGPGMRQVVGFGISPREGVLLGANLGRAIVTSGDFTVYVCDSAATQPSSQVTLGRLVTVDLIFISFSALILLVWSSGLLMCRVRHYSTLLLLAEIEAPDCMTRCKESDKGSSGWQRAGRLLSACCVWLFQWGCSNIPLGYIACRSLLWGPQSPGHFVYFVRPVRWR